MVARRPLVLVNGALAELPTADSLAGTPDGWHSPIAVAATGFVSSIVSAGALTTATAAALRLDFVPFIPATNMSVNAIAIEVTTALLGSAHVGIYSDNVSAPSALLASSATALDTSSTGVKSAAVSAVALVAGTVYWLALQTSSASTVRGIPLTSLLPLSSPASGTAINTLRRATVGTFTALPATAPASTPTSAIAPWIRLTVA